MTRQPHKTYATAVTLGLLMTLGCLALPRTADASRMTRKAAKLSDEAGKLFKAERYREAAERFEQAYALDPRKLIRLRNAGRAYEEAGMGERALHVFERYVPLVDDAKLKADAEARIKRLQGELAAEKAKTRSAEVVPARAAEPAEGAPSRDPDPAVPKTATSAAVGADATATARASARASALPAWMTAGGGLLATGAGVAWLVAAQRAGAQIDDDHAAGLYGYEGGADKRAEDRATVRRHRVGAWTTVGLGAAALAGGVVWALLPEPEAKNERAAWVIVPMADGLRAGWSAAF
jgi:tetratricopeptide (TPR) repeat protein